MRIEISAGGIGNGVSVLDFQSDLQGYLSDADGLISSFKDVKSNTYNLNGGAGNLQSALDDIETRIQNEDSAKQEALAIQAKTNGFVALAERIDRQVSVSVDNNIKEFYNVCPWFMPSSHSVEDKHWYDKVWDWLCRACDAIADTTKKVINNVVDFWNDNKLEIINWGVTALCVIGSAAAILLIPVTGGASVALVAGVSALSSAIIAGTRNATAQYAANGSFEGFDWSSFVKDVFIAAIVGGATGAIGASVGGVISSSLANTSFGATLLNSSSSLTRITTGALIGSVSEAGAGITTRGVASTIYGFAEGELDPELIINDMFDYSSVITDIAIGGFAGGYAAKNNPIGKEASLEDLNSDTLGSKPKNSPTPERWLTEENGKIYIDGNGTWTYQASDGTHVCYSDGFPDFERAGLVDKKVDVGTFSNNRSTDFANANKISPKSPTTTWHHHQDGHSLLAVDTKYHDLFRHRGGFSIINGG